MGDPKKVTGMRTSSSKQNWCSREAGSLKPEKKHSDSIKHSGSKWESKLRRLYKGCGYFLYTNVLRFLFGGRTSFASVRDNTVLVRRIQIACSLSHSSGSHSRIAMLKPLQRIRVLLTLSALQVLLCLADTLPELQSQFAGRKYDPSRIQMETDEVEEMRSVHFSARTEADHHFVMFGHLQFLSEDWSTKDCMLEISVEIEDHVWRQQLQPMSYAFQVPMDAFGGMFGLVCVHDLGETHCMNSLWQHFFTVQDSGAQQLDATIDANCTKRLNSANGLDRGTGTEPLALLFQQSTSLKFCSPHTISEEGICSIRADLELFPVQQYVSIKDTEDLYRTTSPMSSPCQGILYLGAFQERSHRSCEHLVFGVFCLHRWHLIWIISLFLMIESSIAVLRSFEMINSQPSDQSCLPTEQNSGDELFSWQLHISCSSSGRSLWGHSSSSKQGSSLILSGKECFPDAWRSAEYHLLTATDAPIIGSCFYYNCTGQYSAVGKLIVAPSGRWTRNSGGRLTRHLDPYDSCMH